MNQECNSIAPEKILSILYMLLCVLLFMYITAVFYVCYLMGKEATAIFKPSFKNEETEP